MGYRSNIVFAVTKSVLALDLIKPCIPELFRNAESYDVPTARYWVVYGIKWYDSYPEIQEVIDFIDFLETQEETRDEHGNIVSLFGGIRAGEHFDDVETFGEPGEFSIYPVINISSPFT